MSGANRQSPRLRIWPTALVLIGLYALLLLPLIIWPDYIDTPLGLIAVLPMLVVYALDALGLPGLFSENCTFGWCDPAPAGWLVMFASAALMMWLFAAVLMAWRRRPPAPQPPREP